MVVLSPEKEECQGKAKPKNVFLFFFFFFRPQTLAREGSQKFSSVLHKTVRNKRLHCDQGLSLRLACVLLSVPPDPSLGDGSLMKRTSVLLHVSTQSASMMYLRSGVTMAQLPHMVLETPFRQHEVCVVIMKSLFLMSFSQTKTHSSETQSMWPEVLW